MGDLTTLYLRGTEKMHLVYYWTGFRVFKSFRFCLSRAMSDVEQVLVSNFIFILKPHTKLEKHLLRLQHSEYRNKANL